MLRHLHNAIYTCDRCGDKLNLEVIRSTPFPKGWHTVSFGRNEGANINKDLCTMCSIQVKEVIERRVNVIYYVSLSISSSSSIL